MKDLSLHLLDIAQNSVRAAAQLIELEIGNYPSRNLLSLSVKDNGKGMDASILATIKNPFTTTRTLRKVGLGIPFLYQLCKECNGDLTIDSTLGVGTTVIATMEYNHIDRLPLGDLAKTFTALIMGTPSIHYILTYHLEENSFVVDTNELLTVLDGVPIENLEILKWIEDFIQANLESLEISE